MGDPILYTIKTRDGLEIGPIGIDEVIRLAQEGEFSSTSMIYKTDTRKWHLAASLAEIRAILRSHNPRHDSHISKLRRFGTSNARDSRQFSFKVAAPSGSHAALKKPGLLHKIFPFLRKK